MASLTEIFGYPYVSTTNREYIELPYGGFIEQPELNTYTLVTPTESWIIKNIRLKTGTGSCRVTILAGETPIAGIIDVDVDSTSALIAPTELIQYLTASTPLKLLVVNNNGATNLEYTVTLTVPGAVNGEGVGNLQDRIVEGTAILQISGASEFLRGTNGAVKFLTVEANAAGAAGLGWNTLVSNIGSFNTAVGGHALKSNTTGSSNTSLGSQALEYNTTGSLNIAIGGAALLSNTTGGSNISIGVDTLLNNSTGGQNTAVGFAALLSNTNQSFSTAVGYEALRNHSGSGAITAVGNRAFYSSTNVSGGVAIGSGAGYSATTGQTNSFVGNDAAFYNTVGGANTAVGYQASFFNVTGNWNVALGRDALRGVSNTSISDCVALGAEALKAVAGSSNTAVGYRALFVNTTGINNVALGKNAGNALTTGSNNIIIGQNAQASSATVSNEATIGNTFINKFQVPGVGLEVKSGGLLTLNLGVSNTFNIGVVGGTQNSPSNSCAFGVNALKNNTQEGFANTAIGFNALRYCEYGLSNTAIGASSMESAISFPYDSGGENEVHFNTAVGVSSLVNLLNGQFNVAVGEAAGSQLISGTGNTIIGAGFGGGLNPFVGGDNNVLLGQGARPSASNISNQITLGNSAITSLRCAATSITSLSDRRDKTNIIDLAEGLEFVGTLRPVRFEWNTRDNIKVGVQDFGFIAQDLQRVSGEKEWLQLVYADNPDRLEATPGRLIPILVKAIQELKGEVDSLTARLAVLEA